MLHFSGALKSQLQIYRAFYALYLASLSQAEISLVQQLTGPAITTMELLVILGKEQIAY